MPIPALVDDVTGFPGAPFSTVVLAAACGSVRTEAGWHIAPEATETITVDSDGGRRVLLPSLHVTEVSEVRDVSDPDNPVVLDDWRRSEAGILSRQQGWPRGYRTVEVDLTHGYEECPPELVAVVAERCQRARVDSSVEGQAAGPFSVTIRDGVDTTASDAILSRYTIPPSS